MLASTIAEDLRDAIGKARYLLGDKLNEVEVAAQYDVSRNTLREAFATLAAEQLLVRIPNRGVFIATPDVEYIVDLYRARAIIEPAGALWGESLDVYYLLSVTHNSIVSLRTGDLEALDENNQKFHRALVTAAGSHTLNQEMNNLLARIRLSWLQVSPSYPSLHSKNVEENAKIAELLASGQRYETAELVRTNLMINLYRILGALRTAQNGRKHKCNEKEKQIDMSFPGAEITFEPPTLH